jgi:hypothetical protein
MPTIRHSDPAAFRVQADALVTAINALESEIVTRSQNEATIVCIECGSTSQVRDARLRFDEAIICGGCLPSWGFSQISHRYHRASDIVTFYDGGSSQARFSPLQGHIGARSTYACALCGDSHYGQNHRIQRASGISVICTHCASECHRCEGCGNYFEDETQADSCCGDRSHGEYRETSLVVQEGTDFSRFSKRPVGLEIETGAGGNKVRVLRWLKAHQPKWGSTSDGSLCSGGWEYITSPMSGDAISSYYKEFASAMVEREVAVEHQKAGYHVHVNAKDIYAYIEKLQRQGETAKANTCEDMLNAWGRSIVNLSKTLVAPWRRDAYFCSGNFGYRSSKGDYPRHLNKITGSSYPTIAIRKPTLEFRVFPSTANIDWHLGRIEFAQKSVDLLFAAMQNDAQASNLALLFQSMTALKGEPKIDYLCLAIGMSAEGKKALHKMHKCWTPFEYPDGKAVDGNYRREPKARKPRNSRVVVPPTSAVA